MTLQERMEKIKPGDPRAGQGARERWNGLAKPLGSLGVLEEDISRMVARRGDPEVMLLKRELLVICADNGVIRQGVSQSDASVTEAVAAALGAGSSTVSHMAKLARCEVLPVDVGMAAPTPAGVRGAKVRCGTGDISMGPAMSRQECEEAVILGMDLAKERGKAGADILLLGEMGIGNTTTSGAVACALLGLSPEEAAGPGAGLSREGVRRKKEVIRKALAVNRPDPADPLEVLQKVGGLDLAVLTGLCLGAAEAGIPVLLDGLITDVAALCAQRLCPAAGDGMIASHVSAEPAAKGVLQALGLSPCISAGLRLGEGSGAVLALSLLDQALAVYHSGHTFGALGIEPYRPL